MRRRRHDAGVDRALHSRALYLRLPADARLWLRGEEFVIADRPALEAALDAS